MDIFLNIPNPLSYSTDTYSNFCTAFKVLARNLAKSVIRNPQVMRIRFITVIFMTFICGSIFWKLTNTLEGNRGKLGFMLFFTISNFMQNIMNMVVNFPKERYLLKEDYNSNLYGVVPYTISKQFIETPVSVLIAIFFCTLVYFMIGFKETAYNYFIFIGIYSAFVFKVQSFGYIFGCFLTNVDLGLRVVSIGMVFLFLFCGLILNPSNMPVWLAWIRWINPIFYCIQSVMINEFTDREFEGRNFYALVKEDGLEIWHCMVFLVCVGMFLRILTVFGLYLVVRKKL
jgi:ABC-type multidrug transport system permease subunit